MFKIGFPELIVIFLAVILLFGVKGLPDIARGLAQAIKNFRKSLRDISEDDGGAPRRLFLLARRFNPRDGKGPGQ